MTQNEQSATAPPVACGAFLGHVFEAKPDWMMTTMPYSESLITVRSVVKEAGVNSVLACETHHRRTFECAISWILAYWRQVA